MTPDFLRETSARCRQVVDAASAGPLAEMVHEHLAGGGKQIRARIVHSAGLALGAAEEALVPLAAACELLHNASLVHDDLMDGDTVRRGRPALWATHGPDQAIAAGDLLLVLPGLAFDTPAYPPALRWQLTEALLRRAARTACGQSLELHLTHDTDIPPGWALYGESSIGKTGHFFALPIEGAALIAGLSPAEARALGDAMLPLGLIYQVRDDILDLYGDKGRGERGNDIREGKFSALVALHLERHPDDRTGIMAILRRPREQTTAADVAHLTERFAGDALRDAGVHLAAVRAELVNDEALSAHPSLRRLVLGLADHLLEPLVALRMFTPSEASSDDLAVTGGARA